MRRRLEGQVGPRSNVGPMVCDGGEGWVVVFGGAGMAGMR